jgi:CRISPR-associated helicase Cas3/CRISPR-associated endonuclease Cas3-HD
MNYLAHSKNNHGQTHLAKEHLAEVARLAAGNAGCAAWSSEAALAGLLHDLGKYADLFQARLRGEVRGLDHWTPGAWVALSEFHAVAAALAIQGHHIGLQQGGVASLREMKLAHPSGTRLSDEDFARLKERFTADDLICEKPAAPVIPVQVGFQSQVAAMLDVRLLFSCLTDADFLDTEAHFEGDAIGKRPRPPGPKLDVTQALTALDTFMSEKVRGASKADRAVLDARNALWQMATTSADKEPGLFTFTAPTGSGKTLAMLKFALEHVNNNKDKGLKRIILVVPFLSIIEQTAAIYRAVFRGFPENFVLEHHSLAGLGSEEAQSDAGTNTERARRLLAENWDAPIIITTNVQLLESLFSNRPSSCRKLHNLMESVIMFDEAQTLPQSLAVPTLAELSHLSQAYRTTVLFATATQPAFDALDGAVTKLVNSGWRPVEVAPDHASLYDALRRYDVRWPAQGEVKNWEVLAEEIRNEHQVLCVVNLKSHAAVLLEELKFDEAVFHLSTNLCALHRRAVLDEVRTRLQAGKSCRLISTQCVEAGVDVDFPVVYRALAPLDAIAQAAGRCNREGRLIDENGNRKMGAVRVFEPEVANDYRKRYPTKAYFQAAEITRTMLIEACELGLDLNDPEVFQNYYRRLYVLSQPENQSEELRIAIEGIDFVSVAKKYRLIDQSAIQVLVPYRESIDLFNELRRQQDEEGINAQWTRTAQGLAVSVYRPQSNHPNLIPAKLRFGNGVSDEWFILQETEEGRYDNVFGLMLPKSQQIYIA